MAFKRSLHPAAAALAATAIAALAGACSSISAPSMSIGETRTHGYLVSEEAISQIPPGSSQEQVLVLLGTPSTTSTIGGEVFYYVQTKSHRPVAFAKSRIVDQRVVAVLFDQNRQVERVANYGLQDGVIFDFVSRTTPTTGRELTFVGQILSATPGLGI